MYSLRSILSVPALAVLLSTASAVPHGRSTQSRPDNHTLNRERADAVKEAFTFAWNGYHEHAMGHDELHPVSNGYGNSRCFKPCAKTLSETNIWIGMDGAQAL